MKALVKPLYINGNYNLKTIKYPVVAYIKVSTFCNLCCSFCSQGDEVKSNMDFKLVKKLFRELKSIGIVNLIYTGGEPLSNKYLCKIMKYGYELGFNQTLVSNIVDLFKNNNEEVLNYISSVGISLHGNESIHDSIVNCHGAFKIVTDNIEVISRLYKNINININCTLIEENMSDNNIDFLLNYVMQKNIKLCFGRLNYVGFAVDNKIIHPNLFLEKIDRIKKIYSNIEISNCIARCVCDDKYKYLSHSCGAGLSIISIEPNGDVKICPTSKIVLGNVKEQSIKKIWKNYKMLKFKSMKWLPNTCIMCKDLLHCKGGCHAEDNQLFWKGICDSTVIFKWKEIWNTMSKQKLILNSNLVRKEKDKIFIIGCPSVRVNKIGFWIIGLINGQFTGDEILKKCKKIKNTKDFLISLYLNNIIGVKNEKEAIK